MPLELISLFAGSVSGFIFNFIASQAESQSRALDAVIKLQGVADDSADKAASRGGHFGRRVLLFAILWLVVIAPFVGGLLDIPVHVETDRAPWDFFGVFTGGYTELTGIVLIEEVRAGFTACVGFWLGGAAVGRRR